jgi:hypothetical protein
MFGGKLARIGAVTLAGLGMGVLANVVASSPVQAVPVFTESAYVNPTSIPVGGIGYVEIGGEVFAGDSSVTFSFNINLGGGLVIASPNNVSWTGDCSDTTISAVPGTETVVASGTATNPLPVPDAGYCTLAVAITSETPGTGTATFTGGYGIYNYVQDVDVVGPLVTSVSPSTGPSAGGTKVTVTGSGFTGATAVDFGGTPATHVRVARDGKSLTAISPSAVGHSPVDVTVTSPADGAGLPQPPSDTFTYSSPSITSITPSSGPTTGGKRFTIAGTNLQGATVTFGSTLVPGVKVNKAGTKLTGVVPVGTVGPVTVSVVTPGGFGANTTYTYTS